MEELLQLWPLLDVSQLAHSQKVLQKLVIIGPYLLLTQLLRKAPLLKLGGKTSSLSNDYTINSCGP